MADIRTEVETGKTSTKRGKGANGGGDSRVSLKPRSLVMANKGVKSGRDFAQLMSLMMSDLIDGRLTPQIGNATCNAAGKLLKIVELQHKYGVKSGAANKKDLELSL